jgi:glycosyltransferase involved in cell wall biosynthesis
MWILDDARIMGGGQFFALRLARAAGAATLVCPARSELATRARAAGIEVTDLSFPDPWRLPRMVSAARRLRRLVGDGLVVAGSARCQAVAVIAGLDRSLVHLMHERDSAERISVRLVQKRRGRVVALGSVAAGAYGAVAMRNFLLDEDFARFAAVPPAPGDGTLGVLARLIPEKGVLELVRELEDVTGWKRLLVAGAAQDPSYAAAVRASAGARVELLGHLDDVAGLLRGIDVVVVPSVGHEAQPTVILEALAAGRPVVVREAIHSSDYAALPVFPYGDLQAAVAAALAAPAPDRALLRERFGVAQALAALEGPA